MEKSNPIPQVCVYVQVFVYIKRMENTETSSSSYPRTPIPSICLAMIVKNEAHIIERCLDSVKDTISVIVIHDTGSTDGTVDIVKRWMDANDKRGYIEMNVPWKNFGVNRTNVLRAARPCAEFTLMLDADETLEGVFKFDCDDVGRDREDLFDTYQFIVQLGGISYRRNFIFNTQNTWAFEGVVHEYPVCDDPDFTTGYVDIEDAHIISHHDGARSRDPNKYAKDAALLEQLPDKTPRDMFYLAQSYRDAGDTVKAQMAYAKRTEMGGWFQEIAYSFYMLGNIHKLEPAYLKAYEADPRRAEPLLALAKLYMDQKLWHAARIYLMGALNKTPHDDMLFCEDDVYEWRCRMELAVCEYYCGAYGYSFDRNYCLLFDKTLPPHARTQVEKNLQFAKEAMEKHGA